MLSLLLTGKAVRRTLGQVHRARDTVQEDNHNHCDASQAGQCQIIFNENENEIHIL